MMKKVVPVPLVDIFNMEIVVMRLLLIATLVVVLMAMTLQA